MTIEEIAEQTKGMGIQMEPTELLEIVNSIRPPVNMLVFGLGNDSSFWYKMNEGGRTVFLEDIEKWFQDVIAKDHHLEAYMVKYDTKREEWRELIDHPELLELDLPASVKNIKWDIILVDAPMGMRDGTPGRMKSIYMASRLIKKGGDVFVHDVHREVENAFCKKYLLDENFVSQVRGCSVLNHYKFM